MSHRVKIIAIFLAVISGVTLFGSATASAYFRENRNFCQPWDTYHTTSYTFYGNQCIPYNNTNPPMRYADQNGDRGYTLPRKLVNGAWVPALEGVSTIDQFLSTLRSYRASKDNRTWGTSAFMYYNLANIGGDSAQAMGGSNIPDSVVNDVEQRLRQPGVSINNNVSYNNSHSAGGLNNGRDGDGYFEWFPDPYLRTVVIYYNSQIVAAFNYETASPASFTDGVSIIPYTPPSWQLNGSSNVNSATATPGASVTFTHTIKNVGPNNATGIWWQTSGTIGTSKNSNGTITINTGATVTVTDTATIPANATIGTQYCQNISYNPATPSTGTQSSEQKCVSVTGPPPSAYELTPSVTVASGVTAIGGDATYAYSVSKTSATASTSQSTDFTVRQIVIAPGVELPAGMKTAHENASCATYTSMGPGITCNNVATLPARTFTSNTTASVGNHTLSLASYSPGTQICRVLSIDPKNQSPKPNSRDSIPSCTMLAASPYLGVVGGDVFAGGGMSQETCTDLGQFRGSSLQGVGSFGEYGTLSVGGIENIYSSGTLVSPIKNHLMFANSSLPSGAKGTGGYYVDRHCIDNYADMYKTLRDAIGTTTWVGGSLNTANRLNVITAPLTLGGETLALGKNVIIYAPGQTVTLTGNIDYANGALSFAQVPSLIIIAERINVTANVTSLTGVFYARGIFHSCIEAGDNPNTNKEAIKMGGTCKNPFRVNGSVITTKLVTPRTHGGLSGSAPAEMFVHRPEVYLSTFEQSSSPTGITTDFTQELPPRY